jgi:hypothetical protein
VWPADEFGVILWAAAGGPPYRRGGKSATDIRGLLASPGPLCLEVHADTPTIALSDFLLWLNGDGMAWVRIDEHREHYGRDPARAGLSGEVGGFPDGAGGRFAVPAPNAVAAWQASAALEHWLVGGGWWPGLAWD